MPRNGSRVARFDLAQNRVRTVLRIKDLHRASARGNAEGKRRKWPAGPIGAGEIPNPAKNHHGFFPFLGGLLHRRARGYSRRSLRRMKSMPPACRHERRCRCLPRVSTAGEAAWRRCRRRSSAGCAPFRGTRDSSFPGRGRLTCTGSGRTASASRPTGRSGRAS